MLVSVGAFEGAPIVGVNFAGLGREAGLEVKSEEMICGPLAELAGGGAVERDGPATGRGSRATGSGRDGAALA